jgi:flagellar capping protein FliD
MSSDNIQRQIEFIIEHQAKFSEDIERLKEVQSRQAESINKLTEATGRLTEATGSLTEATGSLTETAASTQAQLDSVITEMRDGFNKLILSNEVTRDFANKIASLEVQTSQRMTRVEQRFNDIESKQ